MVYPLIFLNIIDKFYDYRQVCKFLLIYCSIINIIILAIIFFHSVLKNNISSIINQNILKIYIILFQNNLLMDI